MYPLSAALVIPNGKLADEVHACLRDLPVHIIVRQTDVKDCVVFTDQLNRLGVDVLFLGAQESQNSFEQILTFVRSIPNPPAVVAIQDSSDPERILNAIRAGAADYIYPPIAAKIQSAVERLGKLRGEQNPGRRPSGKVLGFTSSKGGCGATTIVCHTAAALQRLTDQKILLADLDLDSGLIGFLMKIGRRYSMLDAALNLERLDPSYWRALVTSQCPRLDVLTAPEPPVDTEGLDLANLREVLRFLRAEYDWILLDLGRGLGRLPMLLMPEIDSLFLIATPEIPALYQTGRLTERLCDAAYTRNRIHFIANRTTNAMQKPDSPILQLAEKMAGLPVYATVPSGYLEFYETYKQGKLLSQSGELARALEELARKIIDPEFASSAPQPAKFSQIFSLFART